VTPGGGRSRSGPSVATADGELLRRTRRRLVAWSGGLTLVSLLALGLALASAVERSLAATGEAQLAQRAAVIQAIVRGANPVRGGARPQDLGLAFGGASSGTFAMIVAPDDTLVEPQVRLSGDLPNLDSVAAARTDGRDLRQLEVEEVPLRVLSVAVERNGTTWVIQVVGDRTAEARTLQVLYLVLGLGGLAALLLALIGGWIYAQRALVPIRSSLARQRDFAADASHELRTPLTVVQSSVEHLLRNPERKVGEVGTALEDINAEVHRLSEMVGDLLLLARADSGAVEITRVPVDLADLATTVLADLRPVAERVSVRLAVDAVPVTVRGDPVRLRQLLTVLVDNAILHSPEGGMVELHVERAGHHARVSVEDRGAGIREADLPHLFERFWRAPDAPEGGSGLGLAIAAWITAAHHGRISAGNRPDGGARFLVDLPAAES